MAHGFYAATKAVRIFTFGYLTAAAMKPTGGAGFGAPPKPSTPGLLLVDNALRTLGVFFSILGGNTSVKTAANAATFIVWFVVHGYAWGQQRGAGPGVWTMSTPESLQGKLGENLNVGAVLDAASVTAFGCWAAALTNEAWEHMSDAARAADVTNEIFQIPAVVGFFANAVARNSENPAAVAVAGAVAAIRGVALLVSSVSQFAVAKTG